MQFRALPPELPSSSSVALRQHDAAASPAAAGSGSCSPPRKPPHELQLQPGTLRSINQSTSLRRFPAADAATRRSSRKRAPTASLSPEPIDYLRLRRTEQSAQALRRNRQVVREILSPAPAAPPQPQPYTSTQAPRPPTHSGAQAALDELARSCRDKGQVDGAALALGLQQLCREQRRVETQSEAAAGQLQELLADIRQQVSLPRSLAPLSRIYARHRLASRWQAWRAFVAWHRLEQQRLERLAPYALRIQRVFRRRRSTWTRARARLALAWTQWRAALALQCWARRCLRAQARRRAQETLYAARLQAAWRGRQTRRQVKKALQERLRWMLAALSPTGNLHRLHELLARSPPALAALVNRALSLVAETHVALDAPHQPRNAAIAATHFARPVEATRAQLFRSVHELRAVLRARERDVAAAKRASVQQAHAKRLESEQRDATRKHEQLAAVHERLAEAAARAAMAQAELETREHVRALRSAASDALRRQQLREARREQNERSLMLAEELSARYVVAETRRRAFEHGRRLQEVAKREQLLHDAEQRRLAELLAVLEQDERKRLEAQQRRADARAAEQQTWTQLSRDQQAQALGRLERREQQRREAQLALEAREREAQQAAVEAARATQLLVSQRRLESAREALEREALALEETRARRWLAEERKRAAASHWAAKRAREQLRYSTDPMDFARVQAQKQQEERERRERGRMAQSDALGAAVREAERKAAHLQLCRERRRLRLEEEARERSERGRMQAEEQRAAAVAQAARRADAFQAQLQRMQALARADETRAREQLLEARRRKEMHDEELRQRRVQLAQALADTAREKRERQAMEAQERAQRQAEAASAKRDEKRECARRTLRMMQEDVASMERQDWEDEGERLEQLLWGPHDAAAFAHLVGLHGAFLRANVEVLQELVGAVPPFALDYDAVQTHLAHEAELPLDRVPPRRRKLRRFFYHEFFEDDPILSRLPPPPTASDDDELRARAAARERWRMLGRHFLGHVWRSEAARRGCVQMHQQQFAAAFESLREAVAACRPSPPPPALVRQLARCCLQLWERTARRCWLDKSLFFLQQAGAHVAQLTSPAFLQETAFALEQAGSYRLAAELLGAVIQCFPHYARLAQVIFRGAVVMLALRMFRQAREYLLHVLEARPFGCWEPFEVQFLIARALQREGKLSRALCEVAYEDAFKRHTRGAGGRRHATWRDWLKAPDTWRRFGDACFAKREFVLASDAYELMLRRQREPPAHLVSKRQQVQRQRVAPAEAADADGADDWLRLARVCAALNDRERTALALRRWFERKSYRARVLEQFCAWPLVRWKLLGLEIPERVVQLRAANEAAAREAAAARRREVEEQRQQVLRQRSCKARAVMTAWPQERDVASSAVARDNEEPAKQQVSTIDTEASGAQHGGEDADDELTLEPLG